MKTAVIYSRTSSSGYQVNRQDTTRQVSDLRAYADYAQMEVVKVYEDRVREANRKMIETNSDVTAISNLSQRGDVLPGDTLYNLQGMRIASPVAGLNILHRADGTSMKFMFR